MVSTCGVLMVQTNNIYMKTLIFILTLSFSINIFAQHEDLKFASINIISSGIIGGIGSGIHKHENQTFGQAFVNGFYKGCIGGAINFESKKILAIQSQKENLDWKLCWGSKIINSISNTIIYNASNNNKTWLGHYQLNIGFIRLSVDHKIQIDPVSLGCMAYIFSQGGNLNINNSLMTGTPIFDFNFKRGKIYKSDGSIVNTPNKFGMILGQNVMIQRNVSKLSFLCHELTHTYQRLQYTNINNSLSIYNKHENWKIIHNDISTFDMLYFIQNKTIGYANNYFEMEANYFGSN
jgi:hypothetical protein